MNVHDRTLITQMGLTSDEANQRLAEYGPNRLPEKKAATALEIFVRQFLSPFIYILAIAAIVSFAVGQLPSAIFIIAVLLLNATIGTVQEFSAAKSAAALQNLVHGVARVVRDGEIIRIDVESLVPGDLVILSSGDRVPADVKLVDTDGLTVDESMLTGESVAVLKDHAAEATAGAALGDQHDRAFAGSVVTRGRARGVVTATALSTEICRIAEKVTERRVSEPPLIIRIRRFTYQMAAAILAAILGLIGVMLWRGGYEPAAMVMMAIGLAVSTIPEGLPAALTVALAIGMRRMAKENVIIRKLVAVEALGSCTFICSDKTGTLTVNEMTVHKVVVPSGHEFTVTGAGIAPGTIEGSEQDRLKDLCVAGILANESQLDYVGREWSGDGDIVDIALLVFAKKLGLSLNNTTSCHQRLKLVPYESERAFSGSVNEGPTGSYFYVKGSPEKILGASSFMETDGGVVPIDRARIESQFNELAQQGYRVIAVGRRPLKEGECVEDQDLALSDIHFLGLVAMIDPIRTEAKDAIAKCQSGGIGVAMVTGDHPATARAIGAELGLCGPQDPVVTGTMLSEAQAQGADAVRELVLPARVFARIDPVQKEAIVDVLMKEGHFVAVTGDGVNDAPAMRRANAGVAMGKTGTDVAKEAADLIVTDDNFASIVAGVEQGRIVYNNIRKVIGLLVATGFSAILLFYLAVLAGLPMPLTAVQLLWLNLVANGIQDVALAFEPKEGDELDQKPRRPDEPVFDRRIIEHVLFAGTAMGVIAFTAYSLMVSSGMEIPAARNATLLLMVLFGNVHVLSSRSEHRSAFSVPYFSNRLLAFAIPGALGFHLLTMNVPGLRSVLELMPVSPSLFVALIGAALIFFALEEVHKFVIRRLDHRRAETKPNAEGTHIAHAKPN